MFRFPLRGFFRPHSATPSDQAAADTSQSKSGARPLCSRCAHSAPSTAQRSVPNASTPRAAAVIRCARNVRLLCAQQEGAQTKPRILRCQRGKSLSAAMKSRDLCRAVPRSAAHPLSQLSETAVARYQAAYRLLKTSPKAPVCSVFRQHCGPKEYAV